MGTFTLTQQQVGKNLYLYPNGDLLACTEFAVVGDFPNYACVDENRLTPDNDSTYVWWGKSPTALDLYELQNHTTEAGFINYIQVYARAKSHEMTQHIDGVYKIICSPDSTCSHVYKSDDINLTTGYTTYNKVWTKNPQTAIDWTWADVDNLCIGMECSSPTLYSTTLNLTLRPNAIGTETNCSKWPNTGNNYEKVDEEIPNTTDYVYNDGAENTKTDLYNIPNHTSETGNITKVVIFFRILRGLPYAGNWVAPRVRLGGTSTNGTQVDAPDAYTTYSQEWASQPSDGSPWTWSAIDSLEIGVAIHNAGTQVNCTQLYIVVTYEEDTKPQIRTTQCYAKINYNTSATCDLQSPDWIGTTHARNTKMLNFWNGTREVYDLNRSGKSMVLTGTEMNSGACSRILCARDIGRNGSTVSITGFSLGYFNGSYKIRSFGWNKISEKPEHYKWIMELEDTEL